ncbi:acireductone synthase [Thioalkalivibrio thiocyanodenitrificans]|uniref:acireductone synthase n=1 Tax=Thioalkalivibrio thiocyanodenitrificans TaxID=243063 RepID=UPI000363043D|nr:acireductone synthase [Thioalkalivibrio thiocyanodenitrificans]
MTRIILTDIEGTTSSLSFVKDVLFPYARAHLPEFVRAHGDDTEVRRLLADAGAYAGGDLDDEALIERMLAWIDHDQKITPLKALQGLIWEEGYTRGDFQGHVYEDAVERLRRWHEEDIRLAVYSSGSVHAQKLLFGHTAFGDLNPLFDAYFDTRVGGKRDTASYKTIAGELGVEPREILFLSDLRAELDAAAEAGMRTTALDRAAGGEDFGPHPVARDFHEIGL